MSRIKKDTLPCKGRFELTYSGTGYGGSSCCAIKIRESGNSSFGIYCDADCPFIRKSYVKTELQEFDEAKVRAQKWHDDMKKQVAEKGE